MPDIPFAYSSNGDGFAEHNFLTGTEREFPLDAFSAEEEFIRQYQGKRASLNADIDWILEQITEIPGIDLEGEDE